MLVVNYLRFHLWVFKNENKMFLCYRCIGIIHIFLTKCLSFKRSLKGQRTPSLIRFSKHDTCQKKVILLLVLISNITYTGMSIFVDWCVSMLKLTALKCCVERILRSKKNTKFYNMNFVYFGLSKRMTYSNVLQVDVIEMLNNINRTVLCYLQIFK